MPTTRRPPIPIASSPSPSKSSASEKKLPMTRDTICRVDSMSKIITSVGVLVLFEEGRFNLDDPVAKYLPEFAHLNLAL